MLRRKTFGYGSRAALAAGLLMLALASGCSNWTKENIAESQRRGNEIISALEVYRKKYENYPEALEQLVPMYIAEIRPPLAGNKKWEYEKENTGFYLGFGDDPDADPVSYFSFTSKEWVMDTR